MSETFGTLLRRLRVAANLSQEALAETARVSAAAIGAYERGVRNAPHRESIALLVSALGLEGAERAEFEAAARRKPRPKPLQAAAVIGNLPVESTSFVGRAAELERLVQMLRRHRLVTLTGEGGIGKTRLAIRAAHRSPSSTGGTWFVDFSSITAEGSVFGTFASVVGLPAHRAEDAVEDTLALLKTREMLVVFDGCEHVVEDAAALASAIVRICPNVSVIATSRVPLHIMSEAVFRVSTLPVPPAGMSSAAETRSYAAVELFVDRAQLSDHRFSYAERDVSPVVDICRRLDGLPLAIELAAARVPAFGIVGLHARIDEFLSTLSVGKRDAPVRQQTLRATLAWSYDLLGDPERVLFRRVSVFAGGWTLDAAEHVCSDDALSRTTVVDALAALCDHCLLSMTLETEPARYGMHEITRMLALEKSADAGESAATSLRHFQWVVAMGQKANSEYWRVPRGIWHGRYDAEIENVRKALRWGLAESRDPVGIAEIIDGFRGIWVDSGRIEEFRLWLASATALTREDEHPRAAALLLWSRSQTADSSERLGMIRRALALFTALGDAEGCMRGWYQLAANLMAMNGTVEEIDTSLREAITRIEACGFGTSLIMIYALTQRAMHTIGKGGDPRADLTRALNACIALEDHVFTIHVRGILAEYQFGTGDAAGAAARVDEILLGEAPVMPRDRMYLLCNRAGYLVAAGDLERAARDARDAIDLGREGEDAIVLYAVGHLATIAALRGFANQAARMLGYVDAGYQRLHLQRGITEQRGYDMLRAALRSGLSDEAIASLSGEGALFSDATAIAEANCVR